jgi:hypothetical protein
MAVLDFLFEGSPPKSVTTYGETSSDTPAWYNDYTQGLISKANAIAAEPYRAYTGPRVAGFTDLQKQAYAKVPGAAASYQPYLGGASSQLSQAASGSALDAAQQYFNPASQTGLKGINEYMNPYTSNVVDRLGQLSKRQLEENIMPSIQNQFIAGGSFGGSRSGEAMGRAVRDLGESTLAAQSQALERGYSQSAQQLQQDLNRLAQMGQVSGTLSQGDLNRRLAAGEQFGKLGALSQTLGLNEIAALESAGATQQALNQQNLDVAYQDFARQRDYPRDMISFLNAAVRGLEIPTTTYREEYGPAAAYQPSPLSQIAQGAATAYGLYNMKPR